MTVLVAKFRNRREAAVAASFIRKMKKRTVVMNEKQWEDFYLADLIDEGMSEKGTIPLESIRKKLRK